MFIEWAAYGIDCLQSWISSTLIIYFPNVDSCVSGRPYFFIAFFCLLPFSFFVCFFALQIFAFLSVLIGSLRGISYGKQNKVTY